WHGLPRRGQSQPASGESPLYPGQSRRDARGRAARRRRGQDRELKTVIGPSAMGFGTGASRKFPASRLHRFLPDSELEHLVHRSTLRTPRSVHVGIIRINESALFASKYFVLAGGRFKTSAAKLVIHGHSAQGSEQQQHVKEQLFVGCHGAAPATELFVAGISDVSHWKTILPQLSVTGAPDKTVSVFAIGLKRM